MIKINESHSILSAALKDSSSRSALEAAGSGTSSVTFAVYEVAYTFILLLETQASHIHRCQFLEVMVKVLLLLLLQNRGLLLLPA